MPLVTYYHPEEFDRALTTSDEDINEVLKEVRHYDPYVYVQEFIFTKKTRFFRRKSKEVKVYTILNRISHTEAQLVSLIGGERVDKGKVLSYLYGYIGAIRMCFDRFK